MGWGWLKPVAKIAAGVAAPFTGGASLAALPMIDALGAGAGAASQGMAQNRDGQFSGQMDLMKLLMDRDAQYFDQSLSREKDGRASQSDAYHKLLAAEHLGSPGARPQLSPYSMAPRQATEQELFGADQLKNEAIKRLQGGNALPMPVNRSITNDDAGFRVDPNLLKSGAWEKILGIVGAGTSAYSAARRPASTGGK